MYAMRSASFHTKPIDDANGCVVSRVFGRCSTLSRASGLSSANAKSSSSAFRVSMPIRSASGA